MAHNCMHMGKAFRVLRRNDGSWGQIQMMLWKKSVGESKVEVTVKSTGMKVRHADLRGDCSWTIMEAVSRRNTSQSGSDTSWSAVKGYLLHSKHTQGLHIYTIVIMKQTCPLFIWHFESKVASSLVISFIHPELRYPLITIILWQKGRGVLITVKKTKHIKSCHSVEHLYLCAFTPTHQLTLHLVWASQQGVVYSIPYIQTVSPW